MITGFVMFNDAKGKPADQLGVFAVFETGLIRSALPVEFYTLREAGQPYEHVPIQREPSTELDRYRSYDNALRAKALS